MSPEARRQVCLSAMVRHSRTLAAQRRGMGPAASDYRRSRVPACSSRSWMNSCPHGPRYATQQATARSVTRNRAPRARRFHGTLCASESVQSATAEMTMARWLALLAALAAPGVALADYSEGLEAYERGDYQGALVEWQASAVAGDARAQYRLGRLHADGHGVEQDLRAAADWFQLAADQGSVLAQHELALMYSLGRGVNQDYRQAAYWYGRLADDGHANSQYLLAGLYEEGKGVSQDLPHAVFWYRRAAEQGLVPAQSKLGAMYSEGRGVTTDLVEAWAWFDLAAARGRPLCRQGTDAGPHPSQ